MCDVIFDILVAGVVAITLMSLLVIAPLYILLAYVVFPHKSLKEGLSDWYHESDDDI